MRKLTVVLVLFGYLLIGCGGGGDSTPTKTSETEVLETKTLAETTVLGVNDIAHKYGIATQGTDNTYQYYKPASNAIDKNDSTFSNTRNQDSTENWWQVELPSSTLISKIMIKGLNANIHGSKVYISTTAYNGTLDENDLVYTLEAKADNQYIVLETPKLGHYVFVKARDAETMQLSSVEVYGVLPATPVFTESESSYFVAEGSAIGSIVASIEANDFQGDSLTYSIVGDVPFTINNDGNITVNGVLDYGTYTFEVMVSDGENNATTSMTIQANQEGIPEDIANKYGIATQGTDNTYQYYKPASNAIDKNDSTFSNTRNQDSTENWWQVELPSSTLISKIMIKGLNANIHGSKVYISTTAYNGTLDENDLVYTLEAKADNQYIVLETPKLGHYVFVKARDAETMQLSSLEAYGVTPATPAFDMHESEYLLPNSTSNGTLITTMTAIDYQADSLTYSIAGDVPFAIGSTGEVSVNGALDALTYTFDVEVSDGTNIITTTITVNVTSANAVNEALSSGSVLSVTEEELIQATRDEIESLRIGDTLLSEIYEEGTISYAPGNYYSQLINIFGDAEKVFPIVYGNKNKVLAVAGKKEESRFSVFASNPIYFLDRGENLDYEPYMKRIFAWLLAGKPVDMTALDDNKSIVLSFTTSSSAIENWISGNYPHWSVKSCNDRDTLESCYAGADLIILGRSADDTDAETIRTVLPSVVTNTMPILYLHDNWGQNNFADVVAEFFGLQFPYAGNYWASDAASWTDVSEMQSAFFTTFGYESIDTMLTHFQAKDYAFDWSVCKNSNEEMSENNDNCSDVVGLSSEFQEGASAVRSRMTSLDSSKKNIFATSDYRLQKLLALIGDKFRQGVVYPMDKVTTDDNEFMRSYYSDHAIYNYRTINPVQPNMGNFSRSDFSHITPITKIVNLTSKKSFRSTGAYALPGQTVKVTRNDSSDLTVKVFINTLGSGATHEYERQSAVDKGYVRPKYLQTPHFEIKKDETIEFTSPYGGPLQLEFSTNDLPVVVTFENVGEHAYWASSADDSSFTQKLDTGDFDWAEVVTSGFEVHSKLDKMRASVADVKWGTAEVLANATERYMSNFPHVLAGFQGDGIDVVAEIHDFASTNSLTINNLDFVKHMNADQASCGYGCSGNPYDAYWVFDPIGHGDVHELGHGLESSRFLFEGFNFHATTNPYVYYTKSKYNETTGGDPGCQNLPFKEVFEKLQESINESNSTAYLQTNLWASSDYAQEFMVTLQAMMHSQKMGRLDNGWHLLARLHLLEREISRADDDWDTNRASLGFGSYTLDEFKAMRKNDWMLISLSHAVGLDFRDYLTMMGIEYSTKASEQVASWNYTVVPKKFFVSTANGYCKSDGTYGSFLDKSMLNVDGTSVFPY